MSQLKNYTSQEEGGGEQREREIIRTSVIGILANIALAAMKAAVGVLSHSIAIVLDAVNNLSDAASSVITIVGTKLAGKDPDRDHPFGHGRGEYLSAMLIAVIILYAGVTSLVESVKKILAPSVPDYRAGTLLLIAAAVLVKLLLGRYVKKTGERVHSDSLINSGTDALFDAVISVTTLIAAVIFLVSGLSLEAWLGAAISLFIIKSGVDMIRETVSNLLGARADSEIAGAIKETVRSFPEVLGAYDLVLHDYGPDTYTGSIHIEVADTMSISDLDQLNRDIETAVYVKHRVILSAIGVYAIDTRDPKHIEVREQIRKMVMAIPHVMQMHGFHLDQKEKRIRFDVVIAFSAGDRRAVWREVCDTVRAAYPHYWVWVAMDTDFNA